MLVNLEGSEKAFKKALSDLNNKPELFMLEDMEYESSLGSLIYDSMSTLIESKTLSITYDSEDFLYSFFQVLDSACDYYDLDYSVYEKV
jgi:hypothetical protein